jgi:hypothetical protein
MKKLTLLSLFLIAAISAFGQNYATADSLIKTFYSCLEVKPGQPIDSVRFSNLFWKGAQLDGVFQSRKDSSQFINYRITIPEYLNLMKDLSTTNTFHEWELNRQVISYGQMMTVYSSYELSDTDKNGKTVSQRGINVLQLFFDGKRWWITYCTYQDESEKNPLPAQYLPKGK